MSVSTNSQPETPVSSALAQQQTPRPTFLVVGAAKAGTTSLYNYLHAHPQVFMSPIKEPNHFCTDIDEQSFSPGYQSELLLDYRSFIDGDMSRPAFIAHVKEWSYYLKLFRGAYGYAAIGECSNSYLYSETAAREIRRRLPGARIIMVLRDPVDAAFSAYLMNLRMGDVCGAYLARGVCGAFLQEVDLDTKAERKGWGISHRYIEIGLYAKQVERYLQVFPRDQIRIFLYENLKDMRGFLRELYGFIGVDPCFSPPLFEKWNQAAMPRLPRLNVFAKKSGLKKLAKNMFPDAVRAILKRKLFASYKGPRLSQRDRMQMLEYFRQDICDLQELIDRDLSHWLIA